MCLCVWHCILKVEFYHPCLIKKEFRGVKNELSTIIIATKYTQIIRQTTETLIYTLYSIGFIDEIYNWNCKETTTHRPIKVTKKKNNNKQTKEFHPKPNTHIHTFQLLTKIPVYKWKEHRTKERDREKTQPNHLNSININWCADKIREIRQ